MKKYLGVKLIDAEPQIKDCSCDREQGDNSICKCQEEGYKVVYEDGYTSWSPKDVFEIAYRTIKTIDDLKDKNILLSGYDSLAPYQQRIVTELGDLHEKIEKLSKFINESIIYANLNESEQDLLIQQFHSMEYYFGILIERINSWK